MEPQKSNSKRSMGGFVMGIALGIAFGMIFHNWLLGLGIGLMWAIVLGSLRRSASTKPQ